MPQITRTRQRAAIAALLRTVPQLNAVYTYAIDPNSPELMGKAYAICGGAPHSTAKNRAGSAVTPYMQQDRGWFLSVCTQSAPVGALNNTRRQAVTEDFDAVLDGVEKALYMASKLSDGGGDVALAFGFQIEALEPPMPEFGEDRTMIVAAFIVNGYVIQSA